MKTAQRFFRKYLLSTFGILLLFLLLNCILVTVIAISSSNLSAKSDLPISRLAKLITVNDKGIETDKNFSKLLYEQNAWAMILNDRGKVIWEENLPEELPRNYTSTQIAQFSKWYLQDYPVRVWKHPAGLFVVGYPKHSVVKYTFTMDYDYLFSGLIGIIVIFSANILLMLILFWHNIHRVEKAVSPILTGIEMMAEGKSVKLTEKGELKEINTELNKAVNQLIKKDSARSEWICAISHDIRTPLSIMLGYAGEIEDDDRLTTETRTQAGIIRKHGEKLRKLIMDLNLASKLEYSMEPINKTLISPVELTRQVISDFLNNGLDSSFVLDLKTHSCAEKIVIEGDSDLLARMLENLIHNSITHNPHGCNINVTISDDENCCVIVVEDTGKGISPTLLERLNSAQVKSIVCDKGGEPVHGLGLNLVRQIVKAHKGKISFQNVEPHGLRISIKFPIKNKV
ncbi:HAMP domain-containing histidine kinase [Acidilutibacter cellobiosedens]|uniref:histidine kinase n=1 Tax=Acidilutibacter cellobiosedens TaxID=2507161 RepID=A0A410QDY8_9FIRM|nr:HAMP domain-containing sensor histidine kinase [Acidilutibacter cellobiosedens]QAT62233.1 HAMP domain-containing histidine kinase [Acidilutibacter cellobiosedens]